MSVDPAAVAAFGPVAAAMDTLLDRYSDDELAVILDFFTRANEALHGHIASLRAGLHASKGEGIPEQGRKP